MIIFKCDKISLSYDKRTVLSDLSFSVSQGDYLCIVGENGSGKSTLMKALIGLIPASEGNITFHRDFSKRNIAYLAQQNDVQKEFPASVYEVILSGRLSQKRLWHFYNAHDKQIVDNVMRRLQIEMLKDQAFSELSGGQRQRVLLARAMVSEASLLLVDEPTNGLDPHVTADLYQLLDELHKDGKTIVMVTHDVSAAVRYATHILHLQNKPLFFGTSDAYLTSDIGRGYIGQ